MAEVSVAGVTMRFGEMTALDDVSLDFVNGGFFALLGPSGSGKTTLLRVIAGFLFPQAGRVRIAGQPVERVPVEKREIGMMFQNYALFPNLTVAENVGFGLRVRHVSRAEERRRVGEALDLVQLSGLGARRPRELSGGQRQRVALARAIVTNPKVLLLDEPLSALDKALRVDMQIELKRIQREVGITTIFVTHDQEEALTLADRIGILRDGRLVQAGPPREVYNAPIDTFTARFLGEANLLPDPLPVPLPDGARLSLTSAAAHAVRPEALTLSPGPIAAAENLLPGRLVSRVFAGSMATCIVAVLGETWKVVARDRDLPQLPENTEVWLGWARADTIPIDRA
ncbi:ABC transporter ATP-binding protein [Tropicimonas sp. IMCC34043]|uniref:ABC transporter ATP-binding protein n=1 Tax=Tropicimonas sp. IMCC34043 TaxID=2248760 RepID=UPI000E23B1F0|nr:ABC transporter ATP-binding protein [Tropicimonas sp. IMCC34043]